MSYELVMVEDGSPDDSWRVLSAMQRQDPEHIVAVQLMRNYGQHNALMCGFRHAQGKLIVTMDDDLQHPPEEIPKLIDAIIAGDLDLVYGCYDKKKHPLLKNAGSAVVNMFFRQVFRLPVTVTAFRDLRRELLEAIPQLHAAVHLHRRTAGLEHAPRRQDHGRTSSPRRSASRAIRWPRW